MCEMCCPSCPDFFCNLFFLALTWWGQMLFMHFGGFSLWLHALSSPEGRFHCPGSWQLPLHPSWQQWGSSTKESKELCEKMNTFLTKPNEALPFCHPLLDLLGGGELRKIFQKTYWCKISHAWQGRSLSQSANMPRPLTTQASSCSAAHAQLKMNKKCSLR